jgi:hypothetical protein
MHDMQAQMTTNIQNIRTWRILLNEQSCIVHDEVDLYKRI